MGRESRTPERRRKRSSPAANRLNSWLKWIGGLAIVGLIVFLVLRPAGVAYTERDIGVVNFSELTPQEKHDALTAANTARCTCGCGMTLAQCVSTDMTCPLRESNIQSIRAMVRAADKS